MTNVLVPTRSNGAETVNSGIRELRPELSVDVDPPAREHPPGAFDFEDYYPEVASTDSGLAAILAELTDMADSIQRAFDLLKAENVIESDDAMLHVQARLEKLLMHDTLSEGLLSVLVAAHSACMNRRAEFFTVPQLTAMRSVLLDVRKRPFLSLDDAIEDVLKLDRVELRVIPEELASIASIADE